MKTTILEIRGILVAALPQDLTDTDWQALQAALLREASRARAQGVVIDVSQLELLDSYATRALQNLARMVQLRGAPAVVVGIAPQVAHAMARLGLILEGVHTTLDLDEAFTLLDRGST